MKYDLIIRNGNVVFPNLGVRKVDIGIEGNKIAGFFERDNNIDAHKHIDAEGLYIFPGAIDPHVHYGYYNKLEDDFVRQSKAAAIGGTTSIVSYYRGGKSYHEYAPWLINTGEKFSVIDFTFSFGIMTEQHLDELENIINEFGITSFKHYRNYRGKVGEILNIDNALPFDTADFLTILKRLNEISPKLLLCVHCENADICSDMEKKAKGKPALDTLKFFSDLRPGFNETVSMVEAMYLNKYVNSNIYVVHLSSGTSVEALENLPWLRQKVTVETTPHYLILNEDSPCGLKAKVIPAIHTKWDSERLWDGLRNGLIKTIGSDSNPNFLETKYSQGTSLWDVKYAFAAGGIILPALISEGYHKHGLSLERIAEVTSYNVARAFNLNKKGLMEIGADADFAIVDIDLEKTVKPEIFDDSDYSVYDGMKLKGWPIITVSRGEVIYKDEQVVAKPGRGSYIRRSI